jgi:DNA polymerase III epsilon subunit-like protein
MIIHFAGQTKPYVLVLDVEHDQERLIQVAGLLFTRVGDSLYQIAKNFNFYIKQKEISKWIQRYLDITPAILIEKGIELKEFKEIFESQIINDIDVDDLVVISHGIHQDDLVLYHNGINIGCFEQECTYNMSKWILERQNNIKLSDVAEEFGYVVLHEHNAYADAWATAAVYSVLSKLQEEQNYEDVGYES